MSFREILGHERELGELRRALAGDRLPHALLLTGPDGIGKSLVARSLAELRACESPRDEGDGLADACGSCGACLAVLHGNHPDVEWVRREPGRRDIGIRQIRDLLAALHRKPVRALHRTCIVDDAHRLTIEAQNAFLKTLEEPPLGALLALVTSAPDRLLPTVASRCSRIRFLGLSDREMREFAERRQIEADEAALRLARGRPASLLAFARSDLAEVREALLGITCGRPRSVQEVAQDLMNRIDAEMPDAGASEEEHADRREVVRDRLISYLAILETLLRDLQIVAAGASDASLIHVDRADRLRQAGVSLDPADILDASLLCLEGKEDLRRNMDPQLALEGTLLMVSRALSR